MAAAGVGGALVILGAIGSVESDNDKPGAPGSATNSTTAVTTTPSTITTTTTPAPTTETSLPADTPIVLPPKDVDSRDTAPSVYALTPDSTVPQTAVVGVPVPTVPPVAPFRSCAPVRAAETAPVYRGDPGYSPAIDRDGDGVACEGG